MTRRWLAIGGLALAATAAVVGAAVSTSSCAQTPTSVAVRTLQQSQKIDIVCLHMIDAQGNVLPQPIVAPRSMCVPVAAGVTGAALPYHLFAVLTQTARGELAVVDLTAGLAVDEDRSTPGTNFIPVGTNPTDVAVGLDSRMTFVASAAPTKPALYAIPSDRLLGDYSGGSNKPPLRLTDLAVCSLDRAPQALKVASRPDGGYVILALLRDAQDCATNPAQCTSLPPKLVAIDPLPLSTTVATEGIPDGGSEAPLAPLAPCPTMGEVALSGALPASWTPGPTWPAGVPYADAGTGAAGLVDAGDGGIALSVGPAQPPHPTTMALRDDVHMLYVADDQVPVIHVLDVTDPTAPKELEPLLATSLLDPSRRVSVGPLAISPPTHDFKRYLYAADTRDGSLMVYDVTDPANPTHTPMRRPHPELNPFLEPDRIVLGAPVAAVSFVENDWPIPSQAESPSVHYYSGILCNPNQNAHPAPSVFNDLGAYYRVDQAALIQPSGTLASYPGRLRGVFAFATLTNGSIVAIDVDDWDAPCRRPDPMTTGPLIDVTDAGFDAQIGQTGLLALPQPPPGDAGDLDPYHTPLAYNSANYELPAVTLEPFFPVSAPHRLRSSSILLNDPTVGNHMPYQAVTPVQLDVSGALIPTTGPLAITRPTILPTTLPPGWIDNSYLVNPTEPNPEGRVYVSPDFASATQQSCWAPLTLIPGASTFPDAGACTVPAAVRMSFDDPTVDQDQDWAVVYEGALPTVSNVVADVSTCTSPDGGTCDKNDLTCCAPGGAPYETLVLNASGAGFCRRGIEDWDIGQARSKEVLTALHDAGLPAPPVTPLGTLPQWTSDYVQITDDILAQTDQYWSPSVSPVCWQGLQGGSLANASDPNVATNRYNFCAQTFGAPGSDPNQYLLRDMPILKAYDGALQVGRFGWVQTVNGTQVLESTTNRVIVGDGDENSVAYFQAVDCCFHHQVGFRVRAGGEWVTIGANGIGLLHHVQLDPADDSRCKIWPDPRLALLNSRTFEIPWSTPELGCRLTADPDSGLLQQAPNGIPRDSPLAMRNPMFSYVMWAGCDVTRLGPDGGALPLGSDHSTTPRDQLWKFAVRGGFQPIALSMSGGTSTFVSPQSMLFIDALGQLAIVDGAQQGLVLIDLNSLGFVPGTPIY